MNNVKCVNALILSKNFVHKNPEWGDMIVEK